MDNELTDISTSLILQMGYGLGHILNDICASLWFTYFLVFFHLVLEFSASQSGYLMLIGQVVDALSTPFVGYYSDNTENRISLKYGKRKLWHLFGTLCVIGSFPFIFIECIGCSTTHKWAQMFYFGAFIMIFQIGWAAVQISHLSLIPELSTDNNVRAHLTAIRFGFTVSSNIFVYVSTWLVLNETGDCDTHQLGPEDSWKFKHIVLAAMSVGVLASMAFHAFVRERHCQANIVDHQTQSNTQSIQIHFLKRPAMYQVAGIYMSTRLVVNISQVLVPLYLHRTLGLAAKSLAAVPLAMYLGSLAAAALQRAVAQYIPRKMNYLVGAVCALAAFVAIHYGSGDSYKYQMIYLIAVLIGFGGAVMLVGSLSLTADLVGEQTQAAAFVYGLMSFTDKLSCGLAIALVQNFADSSGALYYRDALSYVCGGATVVGLLLTLFLPKLNTQHSLLVEDKASINADITGEIDPSI